MFSLILFTLYKFFWKQITKSLQNDEIIVPYSLKDEVFSFYTVFWWIIHTQKSASLTEESENFLLNIDLDGPKLFIFLNTVFMNNFSISKKLSHNDAYICQKNPDKFKFEFSKIFARKPLKKIRRNVVSKFARLAVAKFVMKY